ncbi:MAG: D-glycero-beta-D-manno-heptose 1,7-bisphosphate 7-phosphatase [Candidatus Dormibacteria bacterium]
MPQPGALRPQELRRAPSPQLTAAPRGANSHQFGPQFAHVRAGLFVSLYVKAVFLDRDGVINEHRDDYVRSLDQFTFIPGALEAIAALSQAGIQVVVVTNQSQVGRGITPRETVDAINDHMVREIERAGGRVAAVRTCYHTPDADCHCRKPRPGMLEDAADELGVDLSRSYLVGDAISDLRAGRAAGCHSALVRTGRGLSQLMLGDGADLARSGGLVVLADLAAAARWILSRETAPAARVTHAA